jgi:TrpR family transcriptional regulator, trp operon repressor
MPKTDNIAYLLASISDPGEMNRLLDEILTPTEKENLVKRWRLIEPLNQGVSQRVIAQQLGVSLCKITRGVKILKQPQSMTCQLLNANPRSLNDAI